MWKKPEPEVSSPTPKPKAPTTTTAPRSEPGARKARIGAGLLLKGDLHGEEDVIIEGRVEGKITLKNHGVIIEESGQVNADISASNICVAGEVKGNLQGTDQVVLLKTGRVEGNIKAKSVTLETGAQFKGSIDMDNVGSLKSAPSFKDSSPKEQGQTTPKANGSTYASKAV